MALRVTLLCNGHKLLIPANPYPMYPHTEMLNSVFIDSATGRRHVFIAGPERVNACIVFKNLSHDFAKEYERFLIDYAMLGKVPMKIICPSYIDFGKGMGVDIGVAYYSGPATLKDIITPRDDAGLFYDIELPYIFVRGLDV
jgi:hypothetical protein